MNDDNDSDEMPELISSSDDNNATFDEVYSDEFIEELENVVLEYLNSIHLSNRYFLSMNEIMMSNSDYDRILHESFEAQPEIEKTDHIIDIVSQPYSEIENKDKHKDCCICLCEFEDDSEVSILKCEHILHKECMVEWGKYKQSCPICREQV